MRRDSNSRTVFILDLTIIYFCFIIVFNYYYGAESIPLKGTLLMGLIALLWFFIAINSGICKINSNTNIFVALKEIIVSYSVLSAAVIATVAIFGNFKPNYKLILYPLLYSVSVSFIFRFVYLIVIKHFIRNGYQQQSVLVIGGDRVAERVIHKIVSSPELGYRLYGVLADYFHDTLPKGIYLGKLERFCEIIRSHLVDEVIIALPLRKEEVITEIVDKCEYEGVRFRIVPDFYRVVKNRIMIDNLGDIPLLSVRPEPLNRMSNRIIKRAFNIIFSLLILILLAPFFLILAIIIKTTSSGPIFFKQQRIGINNVEFDMYKFRSMTTQPEKDSDTVWTTSSDSRVTGIGRFMRKTNLDELPQFWNVLIGDMSVVGPRPEREHFVEKFKEEIPSYKVRHLTKSGITGWAQVNGLRGDTSIRDRIEHDIYYIENWSLWFDIKIIFLTIFGRKSYNNAY